jgi:hypothetical protein
MTVEELKTYLEENGFEVRKTKWKLSSILYEVYYSNGLYIFCCITDTYIIPSKLTAGKEYPNDEFYNNIIESRHFDLRKNIKELDQQKLERMIAEWKDQLDFLLLFLKKQKMYSKIKSMNGDFK